MVLMTSKSLQELLEEAWRIRQASFPPKIAFPAPRRTLGVSVTEKKCSLKCAHCGGYYLKSLLAQWSHMLFKTPYLRYKNPCIVAFWDY